MRRAPRFPSNGIDGNYYEFMRRVNMRACVCVIDKMYSRLLYDTSFCTLPFRWNLMRAYEYSTALFSMNMDFDGRPNQEK